MPASVFIETTIPSYYVAKSSRSLLQLARQELTRRCWDDFLPRFSLRTSQIVLDEAGDGDSVAARARLDLLSDIPLLDIGERSITLADELVKRTLVPAAAGRDALHIAVAATHGMNFLLTWNCKHIANPHLRERLRACFSRHHIDLPVICTPDEFIADENGLS